MARCCRYVPAMPMNLKWSNGFNISSISGDSDMEPGAPDSFQWPAGMASSTRTIAKQRVKHRGCATGCKGREGFKPPSYASHHRHQRHRYSNPFCSPGLMILRLVKPVLTAALALRLVWVKVSSTRLGAPAGNERGTRVRVCDSGSVVRR